MKHCVALDTRYRAVYSLLTHRRPPQCLHPPVGMRVVRGCLLSGSSQSGGAVMEHSPSGWDNGLWAPFQEAPEGESLALRGDRPRIWGCGKEDSLDYLSSHAIPECVLFYFLFNYFGNVTFLSWYLCILSPSFSFT